MEEFDPIRLEVLRNRLGYLAEEQAQTLIRSSFSTVCREAQDLTSGIFDIEGNMTVRSFTGPPGLAMTMGQGVKHFLKKYPPHTLKPGDALISNDPWLLTGHYHDLTIVMPVFHRGECVAFAVCISHVTDVGGRGLAADSREVYEEGIGIPVMKIYKEGVPNEDLFDILAFNVRVPDEVVGDIHAMAAGCKVGVEKINQFMDAYEVKDFTALSHTIIAKTEQALKDRIRELPDGVYRSEVMADGFDEPVRIVCAVIVDGSNLTVDYTGTDPQIDRGVNSVYNFSYTYTIYAIKCVIGPDIPDNEGCFRAIKMVAPEGCILNAMRPAPVCARHMISQHMPSAVYQALADIIPDRLLAESGIHMMIQFDGHTDEGKKFVEVFFATAGMGARPIKDGISTSGFPVIISNTPVEVIENESPLFITCRELLQDSGGSGKFRGGLGQFTRVKLTSNSPTNLSPLYERFKYPARGLKGGMPGMRSDLIVNSDLHPHPKRSCRLEAGSEVEFVQGGGGGYLPPEQREPELVLKDVEYGYVSLQRALADYKVAIDANSRTIDWEKTRALREAGK